MKNEAHGEPKGTPKSMKNRDVFGSPSQDPPKDAKWTQNYFKMEPNWSQKGVKMASKWSLKRMEN